MPVDIAENYEKIEDEYWARRAAEAHDRLAAGEDEMIPFSQLVAEAEGHHGPGEVGATKSACGHRSPGRKPSPAELQKTRRPGRLAYSRRQYLPGHLRNP